MCLLIYTPYLYSGALVRERRVEESGDDIHDGHCDQVLQRLVSMLSVMCCIAHLKCYCEHYSGTKTVNDDS